MMKETREAAGRQVTAMEEIKGKVHRTSQDITGDHPEGRGVIKTFRMASSITMLYQIFTGPSRRKVSNGAQSRNFNPESGLFLGLSFQVLMFYANDQKAREWYVAKKRTFLKVDK